MTEQKVKRRPESQELVKACVNTDNETNHNTIEQVEKFKAKARELECDDDADAFRSNLERLAKAPPPASVAKRKTKKED